MERVHFLAHSLPAGCQAGFIERYLQVDTDFADSPEQIKAAHRNEIFYLFRSQFLPHAQPTVERVQSQALHVCRTTNHIPYARDSLVARGKPCDPPCTPDGCPALTCLESIPEFERVS
jgi:hypothetical protein